MKGWTPDGQEVQLWPLQVALVKTLLDKPDTIVVRGRKTGWSTVVCTVKRLRENETDRLAWYAAYAGSGRH